MTETGFIYATRRCSRAIQSGAIACVFAFATPSVLAQAEETGHREWIGWAILAGVVLLVAGILIRAAMGSATPPGWLSFLARRRDEGRPTTWREWPDE